MNRWCVHFIPKSANRNRDGSLFIQKILPGAGGTEEGKVEGTMQLSPLIRRTTRPEFDER